jgi:hypothetical protein
VRAGKDAVLVHELIEPWLGYTKYSTRAPHPMFTPGTA